MNQKESLLVSDKLLKMLICPACGSPLKMLPAAGSGSPTTEVIICSRSEKAYKIIDGVIMMQISKDKHKSCI